MSKTVIEYKTVRAWEPQVLDDEINKLIKEGWQPHEPTVVSRPVDGKAVFYIKGMAKYTDDADPWKKALAGPQEPFIKPGS